MIRINYCSKTTKPLDFDEVSKICRTSAARNNSVDITGFLVFNQDFFVQCLEGPARAVNDTYHRIARDNRHSDIYIINFENGISSRSFAHWDLAYVTAKEISKEIYYPFMSSGEFDPYTLNAHSVMPFMAAMFNALLNEEAPLVWMA